MIDYLMMFGLLLLLVVLSFPTMIQVVAALSRDGVTSRRTPMTKSVNVQSASVPPLPRLISVRVRAENRGRAPVEPGLDH